MYIKYLIVLLIIVSVLTVLEEAYLSFKETIVISDVCNFGGFAMSSGSIRKSTDYLKVPQGATIPLYHAKPFLFENSLLKKGITNPSTIAVGYSLGAISACASAQETLILVAPVLDTFQRLRNRCSKIEDYFQYIHFLITYRKATSETILRNLSPTLKNVLYLCGNNDTISPTDYVIELAKKTSVPIVKVVEYMGTHNFNEWKSPKIVYEHRQ